MNVLHISTECYPAAKAGGMGDVVGALPIYLPEHGVHASVVIPKYKNAWFAAQKFEDEYRSSFKMHEETIDFTIVRLKSDSIAFPFYAIDIPGKFDRAHIYLTDEGKAYDDEIQRNVAFQTAVLEWLLSDTDAFDLLHCHDHMTGLISFMLQFCPRYEKLSNKASYFTIHNGQYRGIFNWSYARLLPDFDPTKGGMLDWDNAIHSLATAIKCSWGISTVSPSYMSELQSDFDNLTSLIRFEKFKSTGILNGIDNEIWDPKNDPMLKLQLKRSPRVFKRGNKKALSDDYAFKSTKPLVSFIGRFAYEKAADLLAGSFRKYLEEKDDLHFFILGSGDKNIEEDVLALQRDYPANVTAVIAYNEKLAHQIYAASDFILMPSRFEPCGLNQMYAMRYGTVPVVRHTGGLIDTVPDIGDDGNGISFLRASEEDIIYSLGRAVELYEDKLNFELLINKIMDLDYSWSASAEKYAMEYQQTINKRS